VRERKERSPSRGRRTDNVGIGRGLGDGGGWMERERGLRRHRGERRPSSERLLPPEAFQHNREDSKLVPPKAKTVPNPLPSLQKRSESREKSVEKSRLKDDDVFGKGRQVSEAELLRDANVQKVHESSTEPGDEPADYDNENVISGDSASSNSGANVKASIDAKDGEEEVFSDFGESDEEILTNDGVLDLGNEMASCGSRGAEASSIKPEIRLSSKQPTQRQSKGNTDVLDISSDLDEVSLGEEDEEVGTTKSALEVDWSELMAKPEESFEKVVEEAGILKRRWSLTAVLNRVGLSKPLVGKEKYEKIIALANEDIEESLQFKPVHHLSYMDVYLRKRAKSMNTILSDGPYTRALTARRDLSVRRFLCYMSEEDSNIIASAPNTNWEWFQHIAHSFEEKE